MGELVTPTRSDSETGMNLIEKTINLADFFLRERLIWDQPTDESVQALLRKLVQQAPNRIYFAPDGKMTRILLYTAYTEPKTLYQGYMESVQFQGLLPSIIKGEFLICRRSEDLETEIRRFRARYGAMGDLLEQPSRIYEKVIPGRETEFIHLGQGNGINVFYRYYISVLGIPRTVSMGLVTRDTLAGAEPISHLPKEIFKQTHPLN